MYDTRQRKILIVPEHAQCFEMFISLDKMVGKSMIVDFVNYRGINIKNISKKDNEDMIDSMANDVVAKIKSTHYDLIVAYELAYKIINLAMHKLLEDEETKEQKYKVLYWSPIKKSENTSKLDVLMYHAIKYSPNVVLDLYSKVLYQNNIHAQYIERAQILKYTKKVLSGCNMDTVLNAHRQVWKSSHEDCITIPGNVLIHAIVTSDEEHDRSKDEDFWDKYLSHNQRNIKKYLHTGIYTSIEYPVSVVNIIDDVVTWI